MENEVGKVVYRIAGDNSQFQSDVNQTQSIAGKAAGVISAGFATAIAAIGAGIAALTKKVITVGSQFETSFGQVETIMDPAQLSIDSMKQGIIDLSTALGISTADISEATYNAISATGDTAHALELVEGASKLATAGFTDTGSALSTLTTVLNSYKMSADNVKGISDSLIATQNLGVTTIDQLSGSMGKAIATASAYGVDLYNLESAYVSLTKSGISTEESTTYLSGVFNELGKTSSDVSKILKDKTGKSFGELMDSGMSLGDVLGVLYDSTGKNSEAFMNLWGSAEAGKAASAIVSQGLDKFNGNLNTIKDSAGATESAYQTMADTLSHKTEVLQTSFDNLMIELSSALLPVAQNVTDALTDMMSDGDLKDTLTEVVTAVAELAVSALPSLLELLQTLLPVFVQVAQDVLPPIVDLIAEMMPYIVQLIDAVLPVIVDLIDTLLPPLTDIASAVFPMLVDVLDTVMPLFTQLMDALQPIIDLFLDLLDPILDIISEAIGPLVDALQPLVDMLADTLPPLVEALTPLFDGVFPVIQAIVETACGVITTVIEGLSSVITSIIEDITDAIDAINEFNSLDATGKSDYVYSNVNSEVQANSGSKKGGESTTVTRPSVTSSSRKQVGEDFIPADWTPIWADKGERILTAADNVKFNSLGGLQGMERAFNTSEKGSSTPIHLQVQVKGDAIMDGYTVGKVVAQTLDDVIAYT